MMHMALMQLEMILPDRAYAFFSHTHKAQKENMPLLDKVLILYTYTSCLKYDFNFVAVSCNF